MTDLVDWIEHRMRVLEIEGPAALAELADLGDEVFSDLWEVRHLGPLQQSQRRRLAGALQISLKKLYALDEGRIVWIEDADRYLAHAPVLPEPGDGAHGSDPAEGRPVGRWWAGGGGDFSGREWSGVGAPGADATTWPAGDVGRDAMRAEVPLGTPVLGRVRWGGRIDPDECWDEQWGRRLPDGHAQRPDTYALETELAGQFVVVRNAAPWEARQGSVVALFVSDGFEGVGYFGQLVRGAGGCWRVRPCHAGQSAGLAGEPAGEPAGDFAGGAGSHGEGHAPVSLAPDRVQRVGRLVRRWPAPESRGRW